LLFSLQAVRDLDSSSIPLLGGQEIEVEGREIFQAGIGFLEISVIDRLDIVMTGVAEIDAENLLSLAQKYPRDSCSLLSQAGQQSRSTLHSKPQKEQRR